MPISPFSTRTVQVKLDGLDSAFLRVRASKDIKGADLVDILDHAAETSYRKLQVGVPRSSSGSKKNKYAQTIAQSIDREGKPRYSPGGAGGGGFYDVRVGFSDSPAHLRYVMEGTGIHGPSASYITAPSGNVMTFFSPTGGWVSAHETEGQEPNREWFDEAWRDGNATLALGVQRVMNSRD